MDFELMLKVLEAQRDELAREVIKLEATIRRAKWKIAGLSQSVMCITELKKRKDK